MNHKKLYRSKSDRMIAGVFGGLGEYLNVDSNVLRIAFILILLITAVVPGVVAYACAVIIIPEIPTEAGPSTTTGADQNQK